MRFGVTVRLVSLLAAAGGAAGAAQAQEEFMTEVRLGVDRTAMTSKKPETGLEKRIEEVLNARIPMLAAKGTVAVKSLDDIVVRVPIQKLSPAQLKTLGRPARLELRELQDVRTTLNPRGRFLIDVFEIRDASKTPRPPTVRFQDADSHRVIQPAEFLKRCPVLVSGADLVPGAVKRVEGFGTTVRLEFNPKGTEKLDKFIRRPGRLLAVALDDEIIAIHASAQSVPTRKRKKDKSQPKEEPKEKEPARLDLTGGFANSEEAALLAVALNSGPLPYPLIVRGQQPVAQ